MSAERSTGRVFAAIVLATGLAILLVLALRASPRAPKPTPAQHDRLQPAVLEPTPEAVVLAAEESVPAEILETSARLTLPYAPGLSLVDTTTAGRWEDRRARIRDQDSGDVRAFAIGDLLPHGSLLVGISTGTADVMVADRTLVQLARDGSVRLLEDFRTADEAQPLQVVPDKDALYRAGALDALARARDVDPVDAQRAIDELIDAGDPVIEVLIPQVDSLIPMPDRALGFPSEGGRRVRPTVEGDVVVLILERITGQTFGDVTREGLTPDERRRIFGAWQRWWGLE